MPGRPGREASAMEIDTDRIDEAVLALLYLGLHDRWRAWKGFDWDALDRLHAKGMISTPPSKAKSVVFTEEGLREAERLFRELFARAAARTVRCPSERGVSWSASDHSSPPDPPQVLPAGTRAAGWDRPTDPTHLQ